MLLKNIQNLTQHNKTISQETADLFDGLFPTWTTIVATILSLLILLTVLTLLVWKPVKKMISDRQNYIQNNIDESVSQKEKAETSLENANHELVEARIEAASILTEAKVLSEQIRTKAITLANIKSKNIIQEAKTEISSQKAKLKVEAKEEMVSIALEAAEHILQKNVDTASNRKLVQEFIDSNKEN